MRTLLSIFLVTFTTFSFAAERNVILYVVDDQGINDAGCMGNPVIKTPGLDTLAASGTWMTHAYCTTPSCSASRSVILSGRHNHANGQYGHEHSYHHFTTFNNFQIQWFSRALRESGYPTIMTTENKMI